ncbi:phage tail protein [Escherichia coli]|nr:phage tail protein [Escherichia coli]EFG0157937.1 phage tail protein [Escherichia coli]EFI0168032.1 phage tail protein [Escherichia coli]EFL1934115.1 phage tail protein [Escherichia coli]
MLFTSFSGSLVSRISGAVQVRPLQILRADGTWENIGGMK